MTNDYSLCLSGFQLLISALPFYPEVDLFATRQTNKLPKYISWKQDLYALKIYAFSCQWPDKVYFFPLINLINKSIHKFIHDKVVYGVIITPAGLDLSTLADIISILFADNTFISSCCLEGQFPTHHPFNLIGWPISTLPARTKAYLRNSQQPACSVSSHLLSRHINDTERFFLFICCYTREFV